MTRNLKLCSRRRTLVFLGVCLAPDVVLSQLPLDMVVGSGALLHVAEPINDMQPLKPISSSETTSGEPIERVARLNRTIVVPSDTNPADRLTADDVKPAERTLETNADRDRTDSFDLGDDRSKKFDSKSKPKAKDLLGGEESNARKPEVSGGRFVLPDIKAASLATSEIGNGRTPDGFRRDEAVAIEPLAEQASQRGENWSWTTRTWAAPNTFSNPLYFEDRMLERHGHERFPHLTPMIAGMRFFTTVPMLPYKMAVDHPHECQYTLGYFRSGSCVHPYLQRPPYERKAVISEGIAVAKAIVVLP